VVHELDVGARAALVKRHPQRVEHETVRMCAANCQPTTRRENASITNAKNTSPSQQRR
jgi:hypothetical protein